MPSFPIVGIGASAGGLKAIEGLLRPLPTDIGMAFVIVQHLSSRYKSLMKEILHKHTNMEIKLIEQGMRVKPDTVFLIPPGFNLYLSNQSFELEPLPQELSPHFVIDNFLHSLGETVAENAIGIVLSGTGTDGSRGIKTIKAAGGIVMAQDPGSAEFDGMPRSAINTNTVDFVLPPHEISAKLIEIGQMRDEKDKLSALKEADDLSKEHENITLSLVLSLLKSHHKIDFELYKVNTIKRRVEKHMATYSFTELDNYYDFLIENPAKIEELFQELLIGVTEFQRDTEAYAALEEQVFPKLISAQSLNSNSKLRIWVCACSTGEEVYSLVIRMLEYARKHGTGVNFTILATDVDELSLAFASKGQYAPSKLSIYDEEILERYFKYNGESYEVKKILRDNIIFARHDVTIDPPFINLDLITCRNLLIYLLPEVQMRILHNFHFGLKEHRFLWLGNSENVLDFKDYFVPLSRKWKVFQAKGATPSNRKLFVPQSYNPLKSAPNSTSSPHRPVSQFHQLSNLRLSYAKMLLDKFAPTCALIDGKFNLLYLAGGAGKFLKLPDMQISQDILMMVSQSMMMILRDAMRRMLTENGPFQYAEVAVLDEDPSVLKSVFIQKFDGNKQDALVLIEWKDIDEEPEAKEVSLVQQDTMETDTYEIIKGLQNELNIARQEVQNSLEELSASNEELQASNEELIASNEEFQSTNEELQSLNEELYTVNSELQIRNRELSEASATIDSLLVNTDIGTLFLDMDLCINFFTPSLTRIIDLTITDKGKSIEKFRIKWKYPNFLQDIKAAIQTKESFEKEIQGTKEEEHFLVKLSPFDIGGKVGGVIVNLIDISKQKKTELDLISAQLGQRKMLEYVPVTLSILNKDLTIQFANGWQQELPQEQLFGSNVLDYFRPEKQNLVKEKLKVCIETKTEQSFVAELLIEEGSSMRMRNIAVPMLDKNDQIEGILLTSINNEKQKTISDTEYYKYALIDRLIERSSAIVAVKNENHQYVYSNAEQARLFNKPKEHLIGSNDYALFGEDIAAQLRRNDEWVLKEQKELRTVETYTHHDKRIKASVLKFPVEDDEDNKLMGQIGIVQKLDIYDEFDAKSQSELEKLIDERTEALIQANTELKTITRSMAHDLRGPLRAIHTFGEMLQHSVMAKINEREQDYVHKILSQSHRMAQIIDSLLSYVKLGSIEVRKEWVDMRSMVEQIWEDLAYLHEERNDVELTIRSCPPIWADGLLLKQILTNLISNALKYRKPDKPSKIEVGSHKDSDDINVVYYVKDNGLGFNPKHSDKIFGVFERLHEAKVADGFGIGLSIVKKSIEIQAGSIWATSELGQGATFSFRLPKKLSSKHTEL